MAGELADGQYRIVSQPPIVIPARELAARSGISPGEVDELVRQQFRVYRAILQPDRRRRPGHPCGAIRFPLRRCKMRTKGLETGG